jgi:hypothetical protein
MQHLQFRQVQVKRFMMFLEGGGMNMFVIPNKKVTLLPPRCCTGLSCAIALRRSWSAKCFVKISSTFVINFVT